MRLQQVSVRAEGKRERERATTRQVSVCVSNQIKSSNSERYAAVKRPMKNAAESDVFYRGEEIGAGHHRAESGRDTVEALRIG